MKTIVEFGIPQSALSVKRPCGVSGEIICDSIKAGIRAANHIGFVLSQGQSYVNLKVSKDMPRSTFWSKDGKFWVSLSVLDGADRGAYAAKADREAEENHD